MPQKHKTDQRDEQVAAKIRFIYSEDCPAFGRGARQSVSRLLNEYAKTFNVETAGKTKPELYEALAAVATPGAMARIQNRVSYQPVGWPGESYHQTQSPPSLGTPAERAEAEEGLINDFAKWGVQEAEDAASKQRIGAVIAGNDGWTRYGIREGDALYFTLDGDAESGERPSSATTQTPTGEGGNTSGISRSSP